MNFPQFFCLTELPNSAWFGSKFDTPEIDAQKKKLILHLRESSTPINLGEYVKRSLLKCARSLCKIVLQFVTFLFRIEKDLHNSLDKSGKEIKYIDPLGPNGITLGTLGMNYFLKYGDATPLRSFNEHCKQNRSSRPEIEYALYLEDKFKGEPTFHALSPNYQKKIGPYYIDFFVDSTCYFFHGCYYHPCPHPDCPITKKILRNRNSDESGRKERASRDIKVKQYLLSLGYKYQSIQQCEWGQLKQTDPDIVLFMRRYQMKFQDIPLTRLNLRESMHGGVCFVSKYFWSLAEHPKETFYNEDINSSYAFVAMSNSYPTGEFSIVSSWRVNDITTKNNVFLYKNAPFQGVVMCRILPNNNLPVPVIGAPFIINNKSKYIFTFCGTCCKKQSERKCVCNDDSRAFVVTCTTSDINLALRCGYKILNVYEAYVYTSSAPVFEKFISFFQREKLKQQSHDSFLEGSSVADYCKQLNIGLRNFPLQPEDLSPVPKFKNKTLKSLLVSFCGRWAMNDSTTAVITANNQLDLENKYYSNYEKVETIFPCGNAMQLHVTRKARKFTNRKKNLIIGSLITANARVLLLETMIRLIECGCTIYYCDTDCIMFTRPSHLPNPLKHSLLFGDFKKVDGAKTIFAACFLAEKTYCLSYGSIYPPNVKTCGIALNVASPPNFSHFQTLYEHAKNSKKIVHKFPQIRCHRNCSSNHPNTRCFWISLSNVLSRKWQIIFEANELVGVPYGSASLRKSLGTILTKTHI